MGLPYRVGRRRTIGYQDQPFSCADRWHRRVAWCLLVVVLWPAPSLSASDPTGRRYAQALAEARAGRHAAALSILAELSRRYPERPAYLYDYITVLGWAGRDREALSLKDRIDPQRAPFYVIESLAKSARNLRRYEEAVRDYRKVLTRAPGRKAARIGLALTLADMGRGREAIASLAEAAGGLSPKERLETQGYVYYRMGRYFEALAAYEGVLALAADDREARRGLLLTAARLGAPHLALARLRDWPGLLDRHASDLIMARRSAIDIRWGRLPHEGESPTRPETERAVAELESRLARLRRNGLVRDPAARRARFDLMAAELDLGRPERVIAIYEGAPESDRPLPAYATLTLAEAYLRLHRPQLARDILRDALARHPADFDLSMRLLQALVENEELDEAARLADGLAAAQPAWLGSGPPVRRRSNPKRLEADVTSAMVRAYADRLGPALKAIARLEERAPHLARLRSDRGFIDLWRGWPRQALAEFVIARDIDPDFVAARTGESLARKEIGDYVMGEQILDDLRAGHAREPAVESLARTWRIHHLRELIVRSGYGLSSGHAEGARDFDLDLRLYDRPRSTRYRPFVHGSHQSARFPEGRAHYERFGAGLEYRATGLTIEGEIHHGFGNDGGDGLSLNAGAWLDDHWWLGGGLDSDSIAVPLRGRLAEGIDGGRAHLDLSYRFHESRRIDIGTEVLDFSDGNRRRGLGASLFQRLRTGPRYKLDALLGLHASRNSRRDAPYFNPRGDLSIDLTFINEWLHFRHYERSLRHRLSIGLGVYDQQGFGLDPTWGLGYEQQWDPDDVTEFRYGVDYTHRVYDGHPEDGWRFHLDIDWRF